MHSNHSVVSKQWVWLAGKCQVVGQILGRTPDIHPGELLARREPLVGRGEEPGHFSWARVGWRMRTMHDGIGQLAQAPKLLARVSAPVKQIRAVALCKLTRKLVRTALRSDV